MCRAKRTILLTYIYACKCGYIRAPDVISSTSSTLSSFWPSTPAQVRNIVMARQAKSYSIDPHYYRLYWSVYSLLYVHLEFNASFIDGSFAGDRGGAADDKPSRDAAVTANHRPVSGQQLKHDHRRRSIVVCGPASLRCRREAASATLETSSQPTVTVGARRGALSDGTLSAPTIILPVARLTTAEAAKIAAAAFISCHL